MFTAIARTGRFLATHPLTREDKLAAFGRFAGWQVRSRLFSEVVVPWIAGTRLVIRRGMAGATGNVYCGLHEFAEMAFVLHLLRPGDLFADVGANVGGYTVLAAGVRRARVVAIEPGRRAHAALTRNVALNRLSDRVRTAPVALGDAIGTLFFSTGHDATDHVSSEAGDAHERVPQTTADALFADEAPLAMKLDVEGYEAAVLAGGRAVLADPGLRALIVELNGSGHRYGFDDQRTHRALLDLGFLAYAYDPRTRALTGRKVPAGENTLYVREPDWVRQRLETAPPFTVLGRQL